MLASALEHYRRQQRITALALLKARKLKRPEDIAALVAAYQLAAAQDSLRSIPEMLEEQSIDAEPVGRIPVTAFAGTASDGRPLQTLFGQAANQSALGLMVVTQMQDAARQAAAVSIAARPRVGYVRMLVPPSCSRCAVLAGKYYRWNTGFQRHPRCDCRHVPTSEDVAGDILTDPNAYFDSLTPAEQAKTFTNAGAEAIRQGADVGQVVNARRGMSTAQVAGENVTVTTAGARGNQVRLMPETILNRAKDREDAQRLLRRFGYIT